MPKEKIYSDSPPFMRVEGRGELLQADWKPGDTTVIEQRGVHVGWSRNQFVEVGVDSFAIATGERVQGQGAYTTLDRQGINRLIQSLRKARDQAYGRDE